MRKIILIFFVISNFILFAHTVQAGVHGKGFNTRNNQAFCSFFGVITHIDVQNLDANLKSGCTSLSIDSPGGEVSAALLMGRLIRKYQIDVQTTVDGKCASACVFLFAAGVSRIAFGPVEIHRPYIIDSSASFEKTQDVYRVLEQKIKKFLRDMNVNESLYEAMMSISPEESKKLSLREIYDFGMLPTDPVHDEFLENRKATLLGFSKVEWLIKKRHAANFHESGRRPG